MTPISVDQFARDVALLWQRILRVDHSSIFSDSTTSAINRPHGFDRLPQPGFVGASYNPGGALLLGQNPGNDSVGKGLSEPDMLQYDRLVQLRDADDEKTACERSLALMATLASSVMPCWNVVKNVASPLLAALGLDLADVAYTNLVKFRTSDSKFDSPIYNASWNITSEQIELVKPSLIVALGSGTRDQFSRRYTGTAQVRCVHRQIGDWGLPETGRKDIASIAAEFARELGHKPALER